MSPRRTRRAVTASVLVLLALTLAATPLRTSAASTAVGGIPYYPAPRSGAAMVYDPVDHYVLMFGGSNGANDTWTFAHGRWNELNESIAPPPRIGACVAWDAASGHAILFGGEAGGAGGPLLNDTWEFVHGNWTELHPAVSPPPLVWSSCAYDAEAGSLVLFGGSSAQNATTASTWTFAGGTWTLAPVHETPRLIPPRFGAAMLYWDLGDYVDMYGGQGNASSLNDSWQWISGQWQEINSGDPPSGRVLASVAYDDSAEYGVLFGGATNFSGSASSSTWILGANGRWAPARTPPGPSARVAGAFAYDAADGYFVLFGGSPSSTQLSLGLNDTWSYSGSNWTNLTSSADRPLPPAPTHSTSSVSPIEVAALGIAIAAVVVAVCVILYRRRHPGHPTPSNASGSRNPPAPPPS